MLKLSGLRLYRTTGKRFRHLSTMRTGSYGEESSLIIRSSGRRVWPARLERAIEHVGALIRGNAHAQRDRHVLGPIPEQDKTVGVGTCNTASCPARALPAVCRVTSSTGNEGVFGTGTLRGQGRSEPQTFGSQKRTRHSRPGRSVDLGDLVAVRR
jgi:hypothetical protein